MAISLQSYETTTVLPNPFFSDSESLVKRITRKYAMNGRPYVYINNDEDRRKLLFQIRITYEKFLEFKAFINSYYSSEITLRDHNNISWVGHFVINPFDFESVAINDEYTISIEFEGTKIDHITILPTQRLISPALAINQTKILGLDHTFTGSFAPGQAISEIYIPALDYLVHAWLLNETSGTRYDNFGTIDLVDNGSVGYDTGKIGNCAKFTGSEYFYHDDHDSLQIGNNDWQATMWVYLDAFNNDMIFTKYKVGKREYNLRVSTASTKFAWYVWSDGVAGDVVYCDTFGNIGTGAWYFVSVRYDKTNDKMGINVNCTGWDETALASGGAGVHEGPANFAIGRYANAASGYLDGKVDAIHVWKGVLLSNDQLTMMYNSGSGREAAVTDRRQESFSSSFAPSQALILYGDSGRSLTSSFSPSGVVDEGYVPNIANLIAAWPLNETSGVRYDSVGSLDLTDNNTVGYEAGKIGNCAKIISGQNEYLSHLDDADLEIGDNHWQATMWVKFTTVGTQTILAKYTTAGDQQEYRLSVLANKFYFTVSSDGAAPFVDVYGNTFGELAIDTWYFVSIKHDPDSNIIGININNTGWDTDAIAGGIFEGTSAFTIGCYISGSYFNGSIDAVHIWKGSLLSAGQLTMMYNSGNGREVT